MTTDVLNKFNQIIAQLPTRDETVELVDLESVLVENDKLRSEIKKLSGELLKLNMRLEDETRERKQYENLLQRYRVNLEELVDEDTSELRKMNMKLMDERSEDRKIMQIIQNYNAQLVLLISKYASSFKQMKITGGWRD
ncbi:MAG: hypothetical protein M1371_05840 [Actinobacteria bacterium]|nr:hypothetical protein [Actinomycetota bacterium]